jgi:hypothetical protein
MYALWPQNEGRGEPFAGDAVRRHLRPRCARRRAIAEAAARYRRSTRETLSIEIVALAAKYPAQTMTRHGQTAADDRSGP